RSLARRSTWAVSLALALLVLVGGLVLSFRGGASRGDRGGREATQVAARNDTQPAKGVGGATGVRPPNPAPAAAPGREEVINSIGMKLVLIPKGKFLMGSPRD